MLPVYKDQSSEMEKWKKTDRKMKRDPYEKINASFWH